ncbi:RusA family crossover junction endodeoxyribonuclease [Rhodococcus qingshengii]|uniref:RusA family crossover junction endodeoxyribonuclease n=1 Tax=Rhodococcus qingshengii TaxID=334542 RepID=UPI00071D7065|nr:RusA family crossover junction endodeoxyribonuclease [Rhodococcus qingshengii]KSU67463.1 hypothetical protein AS032_31685 [Rhodococcus qingshengii]SCC69476.1 Holliday junction resolvase RusA (prophage-encoded endonuclease) [Rhodococcus qingshengii]
MSINADALLSSGSHRYCPACRAALIPISRTRCSSCTHVPENALAAVPVAVQTASSSKTPEDSVVLESHRGGLARLPDHTMWLVAEGKPITQGSMRAVAAGVIKHDKGPALRAWRDTITREALRIGGTEWVPIDGPVRLHVALTVPKPDRIGTSAVIPVSERTTPRCPPMTKPDVDKLLRAVQDALSPAEHKSGSSASRRFKLLTDDSRIVDSLAAKTYPTPWHTHPWALPWPGAVIRISSLDVDTPMFPNSTLRMPGEFPSDVGDLVDMVGTRLSVPQARTCGSKVKV